MQLALRLDAPGKHLWKRPVVDDSKQEDARCSCGFGATSAAISNNANLGVVVLHMRSTHNLQRSGFSV
jgi:hypothetical protein